MPKAEATSPDSPLGYRIEEFARKVGFHRTTISRWVADGQLRMVQVGGRHLIAPDEVERLTRGADFPGRS